jgi:hypothetical protein
VNVLALDPGPHVGLAKWTDKAIGGDATGPGGTHYYVEEFQAWETTPERWYAEVEPWVMWADVIVCEDFYIGGQRAKEANATIEMIGVMRYLAAREHKKFVTQTPGAGKKFAGDRWVKLKRLGWYTTGPDHARSAAGHMLVFLVTAKLLDPARLLP